MMLPCMVLASHCYFSLVTSHLLPLTSYLSPLTFATMTWTRERGLALMHEYTPSDALRKHMYAVEIGMRAMADRAGEDPEAWGLVGLLHDFDYERFPNPEHSPTEGHPAEGVRILAAAGLPEPMQRAILGH